MVWDPTIHLGNIISFIAICGSALAIYTRQEKVLSNLVSELKAMREYLARVDTNGTTYSHSLAERLARVESIS